jgi:T5orf172 domain
MNWDKLYDPNQKVFIQFSDLSTIKEYFVQKQGFIYIAKSKNNNFLKIGRTSKNPMERAKTLSSTGVLHDYEILFSLQVFNQFIVEKQIHEKLKKYRISKEFFSITEKIAIDTVQKFCQQEQTALNKYFDTTLLKEDLTLIEISLKILKK